MLERGRVPSGVVWGGLALLTGAPELSKVKFIFGMYDADRCDGIRCIRLRFCKVTILCIDQTIASPDKAGQIKN